MRASRDMLNRIEIWQNSVIKITYAISFHLNSAENGDDKRSSEEHLQNSKTRIVPGFCLEKAIKCQTILKLKLEPI